MKKILALLLTILLLTIAFVSCNLDGTSGIFRDIALSKAPLSIRYTQILGKSEFDFFFSTDKGIYKVNKLKGKETILENSGGKLLKAASLSSTQDKVFYTTKDQTEPLSSTINVVNVVTKGLSTVPVFSSLIKTELEVLGLYGNRSILITGKDSLGGEKFEMLAYDTLTAKFENSIAQFDLVPSGYELEHVIQQSTFQNDSLKGYIVSFVFSPTLGTGVYEHYLVVPGSTPRLLNKSDVNIANFLYQDPNDLYVLTTAGKLYHVNLTTTTQEWFLMNSSNNTFRPNAFVYGYADADGVNYHLITKPSTTITYNLPLEVFTFAKGTNTIISQTKVSTGYAKDISQFQIISALQKNVNNLLVATDRNGIFEITITDPTTGSGSSVGPESYTF